MRYLAFIYGFLKEKLKDRQEFRCQCFKDEWLYLNRAIRIESFRVTKCFSLPFALKKMWAILGRCSLLTSGGDR
jgi:hypothetical protein